jgi:hypothetical protein
MTLVRSLLTTLTLAPNRDSESLEFEVLGGHNHGAGMTDPQEKARTQPSLLFTSQAVLHLHIRRLGGEPHLWGFERVICRKVDGQEENASLVRTVTLER